MHNYNLICKALKMAKVLSTEAKVFELSYQQAQLLLGQPLILQHAIPDKILAVCLFKVCV